MNQNPANNKMSMYDSELVYRPSMKKNQFDEFLKRKREDILCESLHQECKKKRFENSKEVQVKPEDMEKKETGRKVLTEIRESENSENMEFKANDNEGKCNKKQIEKVSE